ncbi:hypothetical protein V7x_30770 [Crateriforma conspicua]|uniref:Uncharacterized protein n=1 Tax=Crateriforma conspicua TaxID=2527996 RepID=A0A5C6G2U4_9PLAN|nr:hypothetical protein V7x_30770 [Crateriforma conspicua]
MKRTLRKTVKTDLNMSSPKLTNARRRFHTVNFLSTQCVKGSLTPPERSRDGRSRRPCDTLSRDEWTLTLHSPPNLRRKANITNTLSLLTNRNAKDHACHPPNGLQDSSKFSDFFVRPGNKNAHPEQQTPLAGGDPVNPQALKQLLSVNIPTQALRHGDITQRTGGARQQKRRRPQKCDRRRGVLSNGVQPADAGLADDQASSMLTCSRPLVVPKPPQTPYGLGLPAGEPFHPGVPTAGVEGSPASIASLTKWTEPSPITT